MVLRHRLRLHLIPSARFCFFFSCFVFFCLFVFFLCITLRGFFRRNGKFEDIFCCVNVGGGGGGGVREGGIVFSSYGGI